MFYCHVMLHKKKCSTLATGQKHSGWQISKLACSILPVLSGQTSMSLNLFHAYHARRRWGQGSFAERCPVWSARREDFSSCSAASWLRLVRKGFEPQGLTEIAAGPSPRFCGAIDPQHITQPPERQADPPQGGGPRRTRLQLPCPAFLCRLWFNVTSRRCQLLSFIHSLVIADDLMRA